MKDYEKMYKDSQKMNRELKQQVEVLNWKLRDLQDERGTEAARKREEVRLALLDILRG